MTTIKIGNGNTTVNEGVLTGSTLDVGNGSNTITLLAGSTNDTITLGGGNNTLAADDLSHSTITAGNGNATITANGAGDTITAGSGANTITAKGTGDVITVGDGKNTITAGDNAAITIGNGNDVVVAGSGSTIGPGPHKDNGNDTVTAGPNSTITLGDGNNLVYAGSDSKVVVGNGTATIHAGTSDTITIGHGADKIIYDGLTPTFTVPTSLSVSEEGSIALPITLGAPALGHEVVSGFRPNQDTIVLDTADFADFATVKADAKQVGADTVITLDASDTITLQGVSLSSLSASNFSFISGAASDTITITGVPSDETLSAGTKNTDGSWSLTPAQLPGLQLNAGEPVGYPTAVDLQVTVANPAGQGALATHDTSLTVNALPPTVSVTVLPALPGDPATETRLSITTSVDDADGGDDYINHLQLSDLPADVTLSDSKGLLSGTTITTTGQPGTFTDEVDVFAPAGKTTNFDLGIATYSDEPNSPELSASTSQNIEVDFSTFTQSATFTASNQSIWNSGAAFSFNYDKFFGIDTSASGGTTVTIGVGSLSTTAFKANATLNLKAGFQSDLNLNGGNFDASLPFNITLNDTYNPNNQTLEVDPTATQAAGGTISTTGPGGSLEFDLIFDAMASAFVSSFGATLLNFNTNINQTLTIANFKSSTLLAFTFSIDPFTFSFAWPGITTSGTGANTAGAHTVESTGISNNAFKISVDPLALALLAFGIDPDPFNFTVGKVLNVDLLSTSVGAGLAMSQTFDLNATLPSATITPDGGSAQTLTFGTPLTLYNSPDSFSLNLSPDATLENNTGLTPTLNFGISALGISLAHVPGASLGPLLDISTTIPLGTVSVYNTTFPVTFASQTIANIKVA